MPQREATSQSVQEKYLILEGAMRRIADLRTVYLHEWDSTVEAGLDDARDIAKEALRRTREKV